MSLFHELHAIARSCSLTMLITADANNGQMTINVMPRPKSGVDEPALTRALCLTASPDEFDTEFVAALRGYRECRDSLAAQAEATCEVLKAAQDASAKKAGSALAGAKRSSTKAPPSGTTPGQRSVSSPARPAEHGAEHDDGDDLDPDDEGQGADAQAQTQALDAGHTGAEQASPEPPEGDGQPQLFG